MAALFDLDIRLYRLGKKHTELVAALNSAGYTYREQEFKTNPTEYGRAKNGLEKTPKSAFIMSAANEIVNKWEKEQKGAASNG